MFEVLRPGLNDSEHLIIDRLPRKEFVVVMDMTRKGVTTKSKMYIDDRDIEKLRDQIDRWISFRTALLCPPDCPCGRQMEPDGFSEWRCPVCKVYRRRRLR